MILGGWSLSLGMLLTVIGSTGFIFTLLLGTQEWMGVAVGLLLMAVSGVTLILGVPAIRACVQYVARFLGSK